MVTASRTHRVTHHYTRGQTTPCMPNREVLAPLKLSRRPKSRGLTPGRSVATARPPRSYPARTRCLTPASRSSQRTTRPHRHGRCCASCATATRLNRLSHRPATADAAPGGYAIPASPRSSARWVKASWHNSVTAWCGISRNAHGFMDDNHTDTPPPLAGAPACARCDAVALFRLTTPEGARMYCTGHFLALGEIRPGESVQPLRRFPLVPLAGAA